MWKPTTLALVAVLITACEGNDATPAPPTERPAATPSTSPSTPPDTATTSSAPEETTTTSAPEETTTTTLPPLQRLSYEEVAAVEFPTIMTARPGDEVALLGERAGRIRTVTGDEVGDTVLDLSARTTVDGERGLLGLARHPEDDGRLFAHYTDGNGDTVVSEFPLDPSLRADPESERVLLSVDQPARNHNGGMIQFGPDGALYLGLGDGGGGGDQFGNGQNRDTLLGGLVRIDVDASAAELWQYGLRNPWRFWIDGEVIWIADVGQRGYEEVNLADLTERGINYGWPILEGTHCYQAADCDTSGLRLPRVEIARGDGGACSITGGVVYDGAEVPELQGRFLFSDYCGGFLRSVDRDGNVEDHTEDVGVPGSVVSFGVDGTGEVYVLTVDRLLRLVAER